MRLELLSFILAARLVPSLASPDAPWWSSIDSSDFSVVGPDYSWEKRRTGVTSFWKPAVGYWSHFRPSGLDAYPAVPWTSGLMCKSLRQINASSFELFSVYEPSAVGLWMRGLFEPGKPNRPDGLFQHQYTFVKTNYRLTKIPTLAVPDDGVPEGHDTVRATIVHPDAATFSGTRWLPSSEQARSHRSKDSMKRVQIGEMWLAESTNGDPEDRKIGLFYEYHGQTGEITQIFRMHERAPKDIDTSFSPEPPSDDKSPGMDLHGMKATLPDLKLDLESDVAKALIDGEPMEKVIRVGGFSLSKARVVKAGTLIGPEVACEISETSNPHECSEVQWWDPTGDERNQEYWNCRFEDGVYARFPKVLDPDMDEICFELGCMRAQAHRRGLHRLIALGSRKQGSLHTLIYERWEEPRSADS